MSKDIKYLGNNIIILTTTMKIMLTTNCVVAENTQNLAHLSFCLVLLIYKSLAFMTPTTAKFPIPSVWCVWIFSGTTQYDFKSP